LRRKGTLLFEMAAALDLPRHAQASKTSRIATQQNVHNDATWQAFGELSKEMRYAGLAADYHHSRSLLPADSREGLLARIARG
jgi:hypothetical protein